VIEHSLPDSLSNPKLHSHPDKTKLPHSFAVTLRVEDGRKFAGASSFITALEELAIDFYDVALSQLKVWRAPPPQLRAATEDLAAEGEEMSNDE